MWWGLRDGSCRSEFAGSRQLGLPRFLPGVGSLTGSEYVSCGPVSHVHAQLSCQPARALVSGRSTSYRGRLVGAKAEVDTSRSPIPESRPVSRNSVLLNHTVFRKPRGGGPVSGLTPRSEVPLCETRLAGTCAPAQCPRWGLPLLSRWHVAPPLCFQKLLLRQIHRDGEEEAVSSERCQ